MANLREEVGRTSDLNLGFFTRTPALLAETPRQLRLTQWSN